MVELSEAPPAPKQKTHPFHRYKPKHIRPRGEIDSHTKQKTFDSWVDTWLNAQMYYPLSLNSINIALGDEALNSIFEGRATWNDFINYQLDDKNLSKVKEKMEKAHKAFNIETGPRDNMDEFLRRIWKAFQTDVQNDCLVFLDWARGQGLYRGRVEKGELNHFFSKGRYRRARGILRRLYGAAQRGVQSVDAKKVAKDRRRLIKDDQSRSEQEEWFDLEILKSLDTEAALIWKQEGYIVSEGVKRSFISSSPENVKQPAK